MNNKMLSMLMGLLMIISSIFVIMTSQYQRKVQQAENEYSLDKNFYPFQFPDINVSKQDYKNQVEDLNWVSDKLGVNYLKRKRLEGYSMADKKLNYNQPIQKVDFQTHTVKPTILMNNFNKSPQLILHKTSNLDNHVNGYSIYIMPIEDTINDPLSREGTYFIETQDADKIHKFLKLLVYKENKRTSDHLDTDDFKIVDKERDIARIEFNDPEQLILLTKIILFFLVIFLIVYQFSNSRQLSVYKLNGLSIYKSFVLSFGKVWVISLVITIILDLILWNIIKWRWGFSALLMQVSIFIAIPLISFTIIDILQNLDFTNQINNKNYNKINFIVLYGVKGISLILCFFALIPLIQLAAGTYNLGRDYHNHKISNQDKYAIFYPVQIGNDLFQNHLNEDADRLDHIMYEPLNKKGSIVIDSTDIGQPISEGIKFVKVNPNYLKLYSLYDVKGNKIEVSQNERDIVLCIPLSRKKYNKELIDYVRDTSKSDLGRTPKIKIYYTSANNNYGFKNIVNNDVLNEQTIFITTSQNSASVERNIMNGSGESDGLKIPIKGSINATFNTIKPLLEQNNYSDNYNQLIRLSDLPKEQLKINIGNVLSKIMIVLTGLIITSILTIYVTLLFFKVFKYIITVKRVNGYSKLLAYKELWLLGIIQYGIMILYLWAKGNLEFIYFLMIIGVFEVLINLITIKKLEKQNMGDILNGK